MDLVVFSQRNKCSRIRSRGACSSFKSALLQGCLNCWTKQEVLVPSNTMFGGNPLKALAWGPSHLQPNAQSPSHPRSTNTHTPLPSSPSRQPLPSRAQISIPNAMSNIPSPQSFGFPPFFFPPPPPPKAVAPPTPPSLPPHRPSPPPPKVSPPTPSSPPPRRSPPPPKSPPPTPSPPPRRAPPPPVPSLPPRRTPPPPSPPMLAPPPPRKMAPPPPTPPSPVPKPPPRPLPPPISPPLIPPPPPHVTPPSPPSPIPQHTVIIIVFVSLGSLLFLAFLAAALCCFLKKKKKLAQETEVVNVEDNIHVHETIISGPHGQQVAMTVDEDIKVQEVMKKNELVCEASGTKLGLQPPQTSDGDAAVPAGSKNHHLLEHKG